MENNQSVKYRFRRLPSWVALASVIALGTLLFLEVFSGCKPKETTNVVVDAQDSLITDSSWVMPLDVPANPTQADYYNFAWQSFVAMNWPTDLSYRGKPDMTARIGATDADGRPRTTVWQSYKEQFDLFLEDAATPSAWNAPNGGCDLDGNGGTIVLQMFSKTNTDSVVLEAFNEATGNPLIDMDSNYVRYEVRLCESEYQYFVDNQYFNGQKQREDVHNNAFAPVPKGNDPLSQSLQTWARFGATEIKGAWRILPDDMPASQVNRYFWAKAKLFDSFGKCQGEEVTVGLVGLHILRLTPSLGATWFWSTFEQIDNLSPQTDAQGNTINPSFNTNPPQSFPKGYSAVPAAVVFGQPLPAPVPVLVSAPPFQQVPSDLQPINSQWQAALKGTVWENYMLVGTVNPVVGSATPCPTPGYVTETIILPAINVNTCDMANSTMETYMYNGSAVSSTNANNCVVCHAGATPQFFPDDSAKINGNLQVFSFLFGMAKIPPTAN
jgi:hypothetical protein